MADSCRDKRLIDFCSSIGFNNIDVKSVNIALTHPSYTFENNLPDNECYEKKEFLGDAVLKLAVSNFLYKRYPEFDEGKLSNFRSLLVSDEFLVNLADELSLRTLLCLSESFEKDGGRNIPSVSACAFEALLGAFFESGIPLEKIFEFIDGLYLKYIDEAESKLLKFNAKMLLQEYTQSVSKELPIYTSLRISESNLEVTVSHGGIELAKGIGFSKKQAEQEAAYNACLKLNINGEIK